MKRYFRIFIISVFYFSQLNAQNDDLLDWSNNGSTVNTDYTAEIPFRYINGHIFIDIISNNKTYNFLFDTGADMTVIDKSIVDEFKYKVHGETNVSGPLIPNQVTQTIIVSSILISDVEFSSIGAVTFDLKFPKKKHCDKVHGILGTTLFKKAKWQIDYQNKKIIITDNLLKLDISNSQQIKLKPQKKGWGSESLEINLDGKTFDFQLDTGFSGGKLVSFPIYFSEFLKNENYEIVNYGFSKRDFDYDIIVKKVLIGNITLENQKLLLRKDVGANYKYFGNDLLKNFLVTIDWENHSLYLEARQEINDDNLIGFELIFSTNYKTNKIEVKRGIKKFTKKNRIKKGTYLTEVNGISITDLTDDEFCEFINTSWKEIMKKDNINIVVNQGGKNKKYNLSKKQLSE